MVTKSNNPLPAEIWWFSPVNPARRAQMGLVLSATESVDGEVFIVMCDMDVRLAGTLDLLLYPNKTGLPNTVAVFSRAGLAVPKSLAVEKVGQVEDWVIDEVLECQRREFSKLPHGRAVIHPDLEPRWSRHKSLLDYFYEALSPTVKD